MLRYAVIFFTIALVAALFGFGGVAAGAASIAKILFMVFVVLFVVSLIWGLVAGADDAGTMQFLLSLQPEEHRAMEPSSRTYPFPKSDGNGNRLHPEVAESAERAKAVAHGAIDRTADAAASAVDAAVVARRTVACRAAAPGRRRRCLHAGESAGSRRPRLRGRFPHQPLARRA